MENIPDYIKDMTLNEARFCQILSKLMAWWVSPIGVLLTYALFLGVPTYIFIHYLGFNASDMIEGILVILLIGAFLSEWLGIFDLKREEILKQDDEIRRYINCLKKEQSSLK